ncbi:GTP-binding protein GUF1 [Hyaloraphidium curvatum]|nr:GTP-binding protein GUF1 [Hyaloraphidium curvatum]
MRVFSTFSRRSRAWHSCFEPINARPDFVRAPRGSLRTFGATTPRRAAGGSKAATAAADRNLGDFPPERIRNFSIIAHIDHGKSTLADRLLELTGTIPATGKNFQVLDKLEVERKRGITIKAQTVSMFYRHGGEDYLLNLVDCPGHVDFSYEVSRSLAACQGALLLVDAAQGVEAQTVANFWLAFTEGLRVVPVLNKVDVATADPDAVAGQLQNLFDLERDESLRVSAKTGLNVGSILPRIIRDVPGPAGSRDRPLRALLFDSSYDTYLGVVCLLALVDGVLRKGDRVQSAGTGERYEVLQIGILSPDRVPAEALYAGQIGYVVLGMKSTAESQVGDTFHHLGAPVEPLPGFRPAKPMLFAGLYPIDPSELPKLSESLERLMLTDASVTVKKETSVALGQGYRLGFLGTLHMDVFRQRLEAEYSAEVILTTPTVSYQVIYRDGTTKLLDTPLGFPDASEMNKVEDIREPMILATLVFPAEQLGAMMSLCGDHRGELRDYSYLDERRIIMKQVLPMNEVMTDFFDRLKSLSSGYASFDYEQMGYRSADLVKINILLNGNPVDVLSVVLHRSFSERVAKDMVRKLGKLIERQLAEIVIQAAVGGKIIARETIRPYRKNVLAKLYGGDVTRKMKLLEKQKEGKKRMKALAGNISVKPEVFISLAQRGGGEEKK